MKNNLTEMKELIAKIRLADKAYFEEDKPIMTDREYDLLVEKLKNLEDTTGIVFADSPTKKVSGGVKKELEKVQHSKPMLSMKKTKSEHDIVSFAKGRDVVLSWKMDGLTLVLRYNKGAFVQAITRGSDGLVGEDVTRTVRMFRNIPHRIDCKTPLEVRGEGICTWKDHEIISKTSAGDTNHPRNTAASLVRNVIPERGKLCHLDFYAFDITDSEKEFDTKMEQLNYLEMNGFHVVPHELVRGKAGGKAIEDAIAKFKPEDVPYPVDGVVAEFDDVAYGKRLGATAHHENRNIALKWSDQLYDTIFKGVQLVTTRTGVVSIVGVFEPVNMDGARISRAFLHNLAHFEEMKFGIGDLIRVYKANMIIPQIAENVTKSGTFELPMRCPSCGEPLTYKYSVGGVKQLYCANEECMSRFVQKIARFCDKNAMDIKGLATSMVERLMENGWVKNFADLYNLERYRDDIAFAPGFGIQTYENIHEAVEKSRRTSLDRFLVAVGIPLMGPQVANILSVYYYGEWTAFEEDLQRNFAFSHIEGISPTIEKNIYEWYNNPKEEKLWRPLIKELTFSVQKRSENTNSPFSNMNVVVTGTLSSMTRAQIHKLLEILGANVSDNVNKDTDYLIVGNLPGNRKIGKALLHGTKLLYENDIIDMMDK